MPPLAQSDSLLGHSNHNGAKSSISLSADSPVSAMRKSIIAPAAQRVVSFNPEIRVLETLSKKECESSSTLWYSQQEIGRFQNRAYDTVRRFQKKKLCREDCLRGLECQTIRFSASRIRVSLSHDLVLNETTKFEIAHPGRCAQMLAVINAASEEEALDIARQDAVEAKSYQAQGDQDFQVKPFRCFFFDLPAWLVPPTKAPLISDV